MKILITGSEGFIGSHLVERLAKQKHDLKCLALYNSFNSHGWLDNLSNDVKKKIEITTGDIRDEGIVRNIVKNNDCIINLAALIGIPYSYKAAQSYVDTNISGTLKLLQAAKDFKVKKFIHTSTSEVYGTPEYVPIDEQHPIIGQSPYAASKIAADQIAISFYRSFGLPVSIIRPFNTFGPRQSARAIIPTIILQILKGKKNIRLGNLDTRRDFTYIDDTTLGFELMIKNKVQGEIVNLGTGYDFSVRELVKIISSLMGVKINVTSEKKRMRPKKSEILILKSNNLKARKLLKWKPEFIKKKGFIKALKQTIDWYSKSENIKNFKEDIYNI
jgi:NAD dependent epimerase/dehydratase|tara:strand:+ start:143 stop:1135 length:993 start_codon:yes stop_codon:yes gene_type:complete